MTELDSVGGARSQITAEVEETDPGEASRELRRGVTAVRPKRFKDRGGQTEAVMQELRGVNKKKNTQTKKKEGRTTCQCHSEQLAFSLFRI